MSVSRVNKIYLEVVKNSCFYEEDQHFKIYGIESPFTGLEVSYKEYQFICAFGMFSVWRIKEMVTLNEFFNYYNDICVAFDYNSFKSEVKDYIGAVRNKLDDVVSVEKMEQCN